MKPAIRSCSRPRTRAIWPLKVGAALAFSVLPICLAQAPEPVHSSITVTADLSAETPGTLRVLTEEELQAVPGLQLDQRLRELPGFSLFRRSSSLVAHPTTQGLSLRGVGSSGASRSLVLWDGIPINDPFGGWVYWSRVAPQELDRIESSPSPSISVFGDRAMGGVLSLTTRQPEAPRLELDYQGGNRNTHEVYLGAYRRLGEWAVSGHARGFTTDGYYIVPPEVRGAIDRQAGVRFAAGDVRADWIGGASRFFLKLDAMAEERQNGTVLQTNSTGLGTLSAQYQRKDGLTLLAYHSREQFHSVFSAIAADRDSERLTYRQRVPAEAAGAAGYWRFGLGGFQWLAGGDFTRTEGYSFDTRVGGGILWQHGLFVHGERPLGPVRLFGGLRHDFAGGGRKFLSPRGGVRWGHGPWRLRASAYGGFRAPTLNELFREFRVGNTITRANDQLRPETLRGVEAGADLAGESAQISLTLFRNSLEDLITNVTLSTAPNLIVRQRQNAATALSRGIQVDAWKHWRRWEARAGYLLADSRFNTGFRLPQVPRNQGSASVTWARQGTLVRAGLRAYAAQFDDERNQFLLPGFASLQCLASQRVGRGLSLRVSLDNALDRRYLVGFTPTPNTGSPRLWQAGLLWQVY